MTSLKDVSFRNVAIELARFSAEVTKLFFETLTKSKTVPLDVIWVAFLNLTIQVSKETHC